jgi:hypothetical protein
MRATEEQSARSSYNPIDADIIRISKSSLMGYMKCPRQFFWGYVADIPRAPYCD